MHWNDQFLDLYSRCVSRYRIGDRDFTGYYNDEDSAFLDAIGCRPREFFDFVEDFCDEDTPSPTTALLVAAVRRDYFHVVMEGKAAEPTVTRDNIPTFGDELAGMVYLPRILAKARAKLRGELDPDLMYGCGGDRKFLREHGDIHPADFLRRVWAAGDDDAKIVDWIGCLKF
ncbi:hypothetical protein HNR46_000019 [Haloferula luteola]|uniref:DUF5069 domain-containing protein n=1 Tax=Haloferula luteola TaxID=595692 RepID=A0A840V4S6_9BACT|nr:DUF5069 domain-containing protein [Haloferula luteola]MBB5349798.1 hypothetical protein [Haloferula luteola]